MASQDPTPYIDTWSRQLSAGLAAQGVDLSETQQRALISYLALLYKWNRAYNLTAVRDPGEAVSRQLLDSLSILPHLRGPRVLDVGTGAGLPGIPLAIARPDLHFTLLDANGKKVRFVRQAILELGLANVTAEQQRVEQFTPPAPFDTITSRAFASLADFLRGTAHLLADGGQWLAMKGQRPTDEMAQLAATHTWRAVPLQVPGEQGERHAIVVQPR